MDLLDLALVSVNGELDVMFGYKRRATRATKLGNAAYATQYVPYWNEPVPSSGVYFDHGVPKYVPKWSNMYKNFEKTMASNAATLVKKAPAIGNLASKLFDLKNTFVDGFAKNMAALETAFASSRKVPDKVYQVYSNARKEGRAVRKDEL